MTAPTTTVPRSLSAALERRGIDLGALARDLGLAPEALRDPRRRLPARVYAGLMHRVSQQIRDPTLGLRLGADLRPELFGVIGHVATTSETLGAALRAIARYKRIIAPERLTIELVGNAVTIAFYPEDPVEPRARIHADAELAFLISFARRMTDAPLRPRAVQIAGPSPPHAAAYRKLFDAPVQFEQAVDALVLEASALERPLVSADPELHAVLTAHAEHELAGLPSAETIEDRVAAALVRLLPRGERSVEQVASALGMSTRSLQRRLAEHGVSFRTLLHSTRRTLARQYLHREDLEPADIAFLLGFGHVQSFYRAFRRWTGQTPETFRRHALG